MLYSRPLLLGTLLKRYKRFLADVRLEDGSVVLAHVPNSGSMLGVKDPGSLCYLSEAANPDRKLKFTLEIVKSGPTLVGVNTSLTNKLVREALENKIIPEWSDYTEIQAEVKINPKTRLDFCLLHKKKKHFIEVKNVSMARPPLAVFPDAVTERGQKHLRELMGLAKKGHGAEVVFIAQRGDVHTFAPCEDIDPEYAKLLRKAFQSGVTVRSFFCDVSPEAIKIVKPLKIQL